MSITWKSLIYNGVSIWLLCVVFLCYRRMDPTESHWWSDTQHTHTRTRFPFSALLGWLDMTISHGRNTATWIWSPMLKNKRLAKGWKVKIESPQTHFKIHICECLCIKMTKILHFNKIHSFLFIVYLYV